MPQKSLARLVSPNAKVSLRDYDPGDTAGVTKESASEQMETLAKELTTLQALLYAASCHSVLIMLQGMDTSGKDGTISHVFASTNPQGCSVVNFKGPTTDELSHDFLWRVHAHTPAKGKMTIFNRSHYEDVLIARVHNLVPPSVWKRRYDQINQFESLLTASGTIILKFFLHISKGEQKVRLQAREQDPGKAWKLDPNDWTEREYWGDYREAYEDALAKCTTKNAPWYIVPADEKWYRNLAISEAIVAALRPYTAEWRKALEARGEEQLTKLRESRAQPATAAPQPPQA